MKAAQAANEAMSSAGFSLKFCQISGSVCCQTHTNTFQMNPMPYNVLTYNSQVQKYYEQFSMLEIFHARVKPKCIETWTILCAISGCVAEQTSLVK